MVKRLYKKVKSVLFADPELLYQDELHLINQPFKFPGTNKKAVLLIHGWTSTPYEVRRLGMFLNENGYTAYGPMLRGHGTIFTDLEGVKWTDWLADLERAYDELKLTHDKVYIAGTSIGANLATLLAQKRPEIAGLVLMAMPYKVRIERTVRFFAWFNVLFQRNKKKFYPPTFGLSTTITRLISYQNYPLSSARETFALVAHVRNIIPKVKQPCFVMQSTSDHVVSKNSCEKIYQLVGSDVKEKKYIKRAYHTFISDIKNENVFEDILEFIEKN
ncbi:MAG TPA: alpha/beta fold hydrolase [Patescibacteria group bacterium]|nr:alpha/beta fold hydrolase [Patescibacteria group bacterium]